MYLSVPLFSLQGLNGKREGGVLLAIVAGIKNLKKKNQAGALSAFSHKNHVIYSGSILWYY